jgi:SAM-dependent methyltransferase
MGAEADRIRQAYGERDRTGAVAQLYSYQNPAFLFHMQERERALLRRLREAGVRLDGAKVLEVGCGSGHVLQRLKEFGAGEAHGVDLMEARIAAGRAAYPTLHLQEGDAAHLPFADGSFDVVAQFMCVSSVLDPGVRRAILAEMWRVLRPGGWLVSYDMRPRSRAGRRAASLLASVLARRPRGPAVPADPGAAGRDRKATDGGPPARSGIPAEPATPIRPVALREVGEASEGAALRSSKVSLEFRLAAVARRSFALASLLGTLPFLKTHLLVLAQKPAGP